MKAHVSEKMKILYIMTKATIGGSQKNVGDLIAGALKKGYEPILAYGVYGDLAEQVSGLGVATYQIPSLARDISFIDEFRACFHMYALCKREKPEVLHLHNSKTGALGAVAGRLAGVRRIVFTAHGWAFTEPRSFLYKAFFFVSHYITVVLCDATIVVSYRLKEFASHFMFVQKKIHVVQNGISSIHFYAREDAREKLSELLPDAHMSKDAPLVITVAELHKNKGLDVGISAWKMLPSDLKSDWWWVIIGTGDEDKKLRELAQDEPHIVFLGRLPEAGRYLKSADIFLLPSRTEALGYVLLEAGDAKLSVLATRVGGIPEVITHQATGLLVPNEDATALSDSLSYLMLDPDARKHLGEALHTRVNAHFHVSEMLQKTFRLYE